MGRHPPKIKTLAKTLISGRSTPRFGIHRATLGIINHGKSKYRGPQIVLSTELHTGYFLEEQEATFRTGLNTIAASTKKT
jgi:hypothetical protein